MKKLNKLFAILIAVLGVGTLSAQTDVTNTYLTNADFSSTDGWTQHVSASYKDIGSGKIGTFKVRNDVGTAATVDATHLDSEYCFGFEARWSNSYSSYYQNTKTELPNGVYTLTFDVQNTNSATSAGIYESLCYVEVGGKKYADTSVEWKNGGTSWTTHTITFVVSSASTAKISLGYGSGTTNIAHTNTPTLYVSHLKLTYRDIDDISAEKPADLTSYIVNNSFETGNLDGWTCNKSSDTAVYPNSNNTYKTSGVDGSYLFNTWWRGVPLTQTVTNLPNGNYTVHVLVASGDGSGTTPDLFVLANGEHSDVYTITDGDKTKFHDISFDFKITNGQATIGVVGGTDAGEYTADGHWWYKADNFRLTYKGADVSLLQEAFAANYTKLTNLSTNNIPTAFGSQITNLKNKYKTTPSSKADLNTANAEIQAIVDLHPSIVTAYANLNSLINLCKTYASNSYSNVQNEAQRTALTTAATTTTTNGNKATTVAELTEVYNTLETARQTFVLAAYPTSGNSFDMTFKITNPSFETGDLTGWTIVQPSSDTGVKPNSNATYATSGVDGNYLFNTYWQGVPIKQTLADLPTGTYTLTVAVASDGGTVYLTADDEHSAGQKTSDKTVFIDTSIEFLCTDGETTIGVVGGADGDKAAHKDFTENGYWWYKADNFRLTRAFDASTLQSSLSALKTTAANLLTKPMEPSKKSNLQTANNNADTTSDNPFNLGTWAAALETAIAEAQSSVNDYSKIQEYINKTKVFVDASEVATYQTKHDNCQYNADDVETVRRELNIMRYEAASTVFPNPYEVKGWTGDLANVMRSDQHWSGQTIQYYDANSWTANFVGLKHTLSTTVTLPEGTYVLKAAGRSDSDATLRLTIKNGDTVLESVEYTGKGDTGYGITINGCASFSADSTYANNDAGRGWEWEFAKFELDAETTVTLHVEVDYNSIQNRFGSFSDITLWMDDDTYITVYSKELDAPLAEAKTLVDTKPMGTAENAALANAIALGEGTIDTPAQLNAAVDALKEAVADAKAWVVAYNEAKVPLVEALERFEADFNDGANGALYPMSDKAWNTLLTAAGTAASAKDITNSYASFTTDAETFNKAMDDAKPSIVLYKKWAGLITSVQAYYDNIKQDATLNTAISTASAESNKSTDASLASATEALNAAYQEALDGDFDASIFLGNNLDFESGTGTALDNQVFEIPGWDMEYNGNANKDARIQPETYGESNAIRIRSNWEDAPTTMRIYKEVVLPSGSYNLSMTLLTSIAGNGVNLSYYELNGERKMLSSSTYEKVTAPSIELEEPTILLLSIGLTGTTGNNAQELYADNIALACNAKTLYQRTLENIKALAEDGEPTLVATNVYNEYKDKEGSLTAEQKTTAIAVINNAISIDAANNMVTSLIKNADFTGGTNSYSVQGSGGQVQAPKEWTFGYTFEGWNDTKVTDGYFNLWAGVIKYGELSQVINNLPNGTYKLTADVVTSSTDGSSIVAIYGAPANGNIARSKNADNSDDYLNYEVYFKVVDNQATIGIRTDNHYFKLKNIQLEYVEDDAVAVDNGILYQAAFINRGNTTWDITEITPNASEASIYMSSPNALIIANEGQVSNVNNVIVDGTAASLVLNDGGYAFNTTTDFTATALNYAREFTKDTWLTVCLPFAYPIPENVKVETLGAIDLDTKTFTFDEVTGTMEANKPYLIKNSTETAALFASFGNVEVKATPAAMNVTITADNSAHQGEFIGTYTTVKTDDMMEDGTYDILFFGTDGQLYYLSQGVTTKNITIKPFRAYIRLPKDAINWSDGQQARVRHRNSEMTEIEGSELDAQGSVLIYDLMGRRVAEMVKGSIYIVNGKKMIVK